MKIFIIFELLLPCSLQPENLFEVNYFFNERNHTTLILLLILKILNLYYVMCLKNLNHLGLVIESLSLFVRRQCLSLER